MVKNYLRLFIKKIVIKLPIVEIEGKAEGVLAALRNKKAVRTGEVLTAMDYWLPVRIANQRGEFVPVLPIGYDGFSGEKPKPSAKKKPAKILPKKHIIHKAVKWKKMIDDGIISSMSDIASKEGLTRARVTQIMNLLKLRAEMQENLLSLDDPKEIIKFSERKLRAIHKR